MSFNVFLAVAFVIWSSGNLLWMTVSKQTSVVSLPAQLGRTLCGQLRSLLVNGMPVARLQSRELVTSEQAHPACRSPWDVHKQSADLAVDEQQDCVK
jgi:hypothetical protein